MSELSDLLFPKLAPEQRAAIVRASAAFALWRSCPRGACRRAHACRGFAEAFMPDCAPVLAECVRETREALMAFVPKRPADGMNRELGRVMRRVCALMERKVEEMERRAGRGVS